MSDKTIMIVDDVASNRMLLRMILEDDFTIVECESGPECLKAVEENKPDIILLDVNMPEMTGYEVCTTLRAHEETSALPIIFVSAMDDVEERLAGFEAGCDEYLTKPIDTEKLLIKIQQQLASQKEVENAKANASQAMKVAMEAMTSSSELGQIIEFVKSSQEVHTLAKMGEELCLLADSFGLSASAVIYGVPNIYVRCEKDSMECRVLNKFKHSKERIVSIGVRTIICSESIGLLINDMPIEDESRYGRFKDHLMVLSSICEGRIMAIHSQLQLVGQRKEVMEHVITMIEEQVKKLTTKLDVYDKSVQKIMTDMVGELETKLFSLGLDEDQEAELMTLAYEATNKLEGLQAGASELEKELGVILERLYEVLHKQ
jgi:CheY-like chemotaxis protein